MADEPWTPETEELLARLLAMGEWDAQPNDRDTFRYGARTVLATLASAGLLLPVGGETREEWSVRWPDSVSLIPLDEERARREATEHAATGARLYCRTVHTGPWRPATEEPSRDR